MDVQMPGLYGIEATRQVTSESPSVGVVVLTMSEDDGTVFSAVRAGARGYLLKGADQEGVVRAITTVAAGARSSGPRWRAGSPSSSPPHPPVRPRRSRS